MHCLRNTICILLLLSTMAMLSGCREDVREFIPYVPTPENLDQLLQQTPDPTTRTVFQFGGNALPDTMLTAASGVRVFLADTENLFADEAGTPVPCSTCPSLQVEVVAVQRRSDFVSRNLPTTTYPESKVLESAGAVQVRATCGSKTLRLLPNRYLKVQLPVENTPSSVWIYSGEPDGQAPVKGWVNTNSTPFLAQWPSHTGGMQQSGYELILSQMGWSNCARPLPEQSSSFCVTLPDQFTALNTRVFLVFQSVNATVALEGSETSSEFCFPEAPLGYPVKIIVVGKTGGQYWLGNAFTEIGTNVKMNVTPNPWQEQELIQFLKSL